MSGSNKTTSSRHSDGKTKEFVCLGGILQLIKEKCDDNTDIYGFEKPRKSENLRNVYDKWDKEYSIYRIKRKEKWDVLLRRSGVLSKNSPDTLSKHGHNALLKHIHDPLTLSGGNQGPIFPELDKKIKRYIRKGIPLEYRGSVWAHYSGAEDLRRKQPHLYGQLVENVDNTSRKDMESIERDLERTFPDNFYFKTNKEDSQVIGKLRRVLQAFAQFNPQIGYCQSLNFIAGLLLLFADETTTFWMLVTITSKIVPNMHDQTLEGANVDQHVFFLALKQQHHGLWRHICNISQYSSGSQLPQITLVVMSWFMSLFISSLPVETTLCFWDVLFWYVNILIIFIVF